MTDPYLLNSFYESHILGKPYHEELRPSSLTRISHPRITLSGIDPVVQHRSASSLSRHGLKYDRQSYSRDTHHSIGHTHYRPLQKSLAGSHGRETIFSPPPLPSRIYTKRPSEKTYKSPRTQHELQESGDVFNQIDSSYHQNGEDGLTWKRLNHTPPRMVEKKSPPHQNYSRYKVLRDRMPVQRFKRKDDDFIRTDTSQHSTEDDSSGHYRTVLYVVPSSPKSSSPSNWGTQTIERVALPTLSNSKSGVYLEGNHATTNDSSLRPHSIKDNSKTDAPGSSIDEASSSEESSRYPISRPKIIFQGPGRYLETKPYCKTIPSPQLMEITKKSNGLHNVTPPTRTVPVIQKSPLKVIQNDYNQVVVDIKPRHLNEADKHQHVSQWIEVGTLGDTVQSKQDVNESIMDDRDFIDQTDVEDAIEGVELNGRVHTATTCDSVTPDNQQINDDIYRDVTNPYTLKVDCFPRPPMYTASKHVTDALTHTQEEHSTSETGQAGSIKSNLTLNVSSSPNKVSNINPGFPESRGNLGYIHSSRKETVNSHFIRTLSPTMTDHSHNLKPSKISIPVYKQEETGREVEIVANKKIKPQVAPKPHPKQQKPLVTENPSTESELKYAEKRPISKTPGSSDNQSNHHAAENLHGQMNGNCSSTEAPIDNPGSTVKSLTAYFMNIINRQKGSYESNTFPRMRGRESTYSLGRDERGLPTSSSPFFQNESPEERERRLRAVDALRHRTLPLQTIDYSRIGSINSTRSLNEGSYDEYYPYVRPSSVPRPRTKCLTTNITRSATTLSGDSNP